MRENDLTLGILKPPILNVFRRKRVKTLLSINLVDSLLSLVFPVFRRSFGYLSGLSGNWGLSGTSRHPFCS